MDILKYKDEKDRAYGLGGMITCMYCLENERYIESVSLDNEADKGIVFTPDFYSVKNQKLSAKAVWNDEMNHFQLIAGLLMSNLMARVIVRQYEDITNDMNNSLMAMLKEEGKEHCELEEDEVADIFYNTYKFFHRIFTHREVADIINGFVSCIEQERAMDKERISNFFRLLSR